uniref:DUF834 domain-containing protein n=1 Tax=Oryza nivara TaxID=4536 RepID=A0A0E0HMI7_ORYNI
MAAAGLAAAATPGSGTGGPKGGAGRISVGVELGAREKVEAGKDEAGDLSSGRHSGRGAPTTGRWWPPDPSCSSQIWRGCGGDGDGGGDGVGRGREGGCGGPYAATTWCSAATAAVSLRSAPLGRIWKVAGGGRRRLTCDGWRRQLATVAMVVVAAVGSDGVG